MQEPEQLSLEIERMDEHCRRSQPCILNVRLINTGQKPITVNQRMALGYRDSLSRELFADLVEAESNQPAKIRLARYDRDFSESSDYVILSPQQELSKPVDLFKYYLPANPGKYRLTLHYQADEELAQAPADVVKGIVSSEPVDLFVE